MILLRPARCSARRMPVASLAILCAPSVCCAAAYVEVVSWETIVGDGAGTSHWSHAVDGTTSYHTVNLGSDPRITKVENLGGATNTTVLVSSAQWLAASGQTSMANANGFGVFGNAVLWLDTGSDAIWIANATSGGVVPYVSTADITAHTGEASAQALENYSITSDGQVVWYEGQSDSILVTAGAGNVVTLVSAAQLTALMGDSSVRGGFGYDALDRLYWGHLATDSMYRRDADGTLGVALTAAQITAVSGEAGADFGDIFGAPDGWVYWYERTGDNIMRFDPADPAGTLEIVLTEDQLSGGPAASDNLFTLGWYGGRLTFNVIGETGLYVIGCAGDITGPRKGTPDNNVDSLDFLALIGQWGSCALAPCSADITGPRAGVPDDVVDSLDFLLLISQWGSPGNCPLPSSTLR